MSLGQWNWRDGIAEVLGPLPVTDLRHIFEMLSNIVVVALQFLIEKVDSIFSLQMKMQGPPQSPMPLEKMN
jgi:hypothetical protein